MKVTRERELYERYLYRLHRPIYLAEKHSIFNLTTREFNEFLWEVKKALKKQDQEYCDDCGQKLDWRNNEN